MFERVDRIFVAVHDLDKAKQSYGRILGAVPVAESRSKVLGADVVTLQLGSSQVELCSPVEDGVAGTHLARYGEGLFCGGLSVSDIAACGEQLRQAGIGHVREGNRIFPDPAALFGLPLAITQSSPQPLAEYAGPVDFLYEITQVLETRWQEVADHYHRKLSLNKEIYVPIGSPRFGYQGTLMMFREGHLDRIELAEAHDPAFPMGRFVKKRGDSLYMCYVECNDLADIIARLDEQGCPWTGRTQAAVEEDGIWIHPSALNGVLMGVSRRTLAWEWSGKPERVEPVSG